MGVKMKQDLEELIINEKGEIITSDGKTVSELYPIGSPIVIDKDSILGEDIRYVWRMEELYKYQVAPPEANAYLIGDEHHPNWRFHHPECLAVQFYRVKTKEEK